LDQIVNKLKERQEVIRILDKSAAIQEENHPLPVASLGKRKERTYEEIAEEVRTSID
jgi:hypothetical protein